MAKIISEKRVLEYSKDFKVKVVHLTNIEGIQIKQVAEGMGLHPLMISRWRKEFRDGKLVADDSRKVLMTLHRKSPPSKKQLSDIEKLQKENTRLKKENDLLKKWQRYLAEVRKKDSDI